MIGRETYIRGFTYLSPLLLIGIFTKDDRHAHP